MEQLNLTVNGAYVVEELNLKNNFHIFKNTTKSYRDFCTTKIQIDNAQFSNAYQSTMITERDKNIYQQYKLMRPFDAWT